MGRDYPKAPCWATKQDTPCPLLLKCSKCKQLLPVVSFYGLIDSAGSNRRDRLGTRRSSCCRECSIAAYIELPQVLKLLHAAKKRAKLKGLDFDLKPEDIAIPSHCPVLGIPLFSNTGQGRMGGALSQNAPSLDRIDNAKGYIKGNVCVISRRANTLKGNGSPKELAAVALYAARAASGEYAGNAMGISFIDMQQLA